MTPLTSKPDATYHARLLFRAVGQGPSHQWHAGQASLLGWPELGRHDRISLPFSRHAQGVLEEIGTRYYKLLAMARRTRAVPHADDG